MIPATTGTSRAAGSKTSAAASGASVVELMRRGGHANPVAALRYQHAIEDSDRAIADALASLATGEVARRGDHDRTRRGPTPSAETPFELGG